MERIPIGESFDTDLASFREYLSSQLGTFEEAANISDEAALQWRAINFINGVEVARECELVFEEGTKKIESASLLNRVREHVNDGDTALVELLAGLEFSVSQHEERTESISNPASASEAEAERLFIFWDCEPFIQLHLNKN